MLYRLYHCFSGYLRLEIRMKNASRALNRFLAGNVRFWGLENESDEVLRLCVSRGMRRECAAILSELRHRYRAECEMSEYGLCVLLSRYAKRYGLLFGAACGIFFTILSTFFVWGVTIETNTVRFTEDQLYDFLASCGVRPGMTVAQAEEEGLPLRFQLEHPEFVFVSFNVEGTHLTAELMERTQVPPTEEEQGVCHLTAKTGGVIRSCEVYNGEPMVKVGDVVEQGDLIVSGTMTLRAGGYRLVQSRAKILAETYREFTCVIPLESETEICTGEETVKTAVSILGFDLFSFFSPGSPYEHSLTTEEVYPLEIFGRRLPLSLHRYTHSELATVCVKRTASEAKKLCYDDYRTWLSEILGAEGELLSEELSYTETETGICLNVGVTCLEDIAVVTPFTFRPLAESGSEPNA